MATNKIRKHDVDLKPEDIGIKQDVYASDCNNAIDANITYYTDGSSVNIPTTTGEWFIIQNAKRQNGFLRQIAYSMSDSRVFYRYCSKSTWSVWTTEFLPLTGGTLSGVLYLQKYGYLNSIEDYTYLTHQNSDVVKYLTVSASYDAREAVKLIHSGVQAYNLYGEHNKPSGSYTGNGSATERKIEVGGFGGSITIYNSTTGRAMGIVTAGGAIIKSDTTLTGVARTEARFSEGVLTIASTHEALNANGKTYAFKLL